jgi:hypothetical protein
MLDEAFLIKNEITHTNYIRLLLIGLSSNITEQVCRFTSVRASLGSSGHTVHEVKVPIHFVCVEQRTFFHPFNGQFSLYSTRVD